MRPAESNRSGNRALTIIQRLAGHFASDDAER